MRATNQIRAIAQFRSQRLIMEASYPRRRSKTRLPWAIIGRPYQGFQYAALPTIGSQR